MARNGLAGIARLRADLVVRCACDLQGIVSVPPSTTIRLDLTVQEFQRILQERYGAQFPQLVYCDEDSIERARLDRRRFPEVPKVMLRRGAPRQRATVRRRGPV